MIDKTSSGCDLCRHKNSLSSTLLLYSSGSQTVVHVPVVVCEGLQGGAQIDLLSVFLHKKLY